MTCKSEVLYGIISILFFYVGVLLIHDHTNRTTVKLKLFMRDTKSELKETLYGLLFYANNSAASLSN